MSITIPMFSGTIPYVTTEQMIEVDRAMVEDVRIELIQMMENAGRNLAHLARIRFFDGNPHGKHVVWGARVQVVVTHPAENFTPLRAHQLDSLRRMQVPVAQAEAVNQLGSPALIVDGLVGYRLRGAPHGPVADLIHWANVEAAPILALDVPSGVDTTSGPVFDPAIKATATMTLALPKAGLRAPGVETLVGELYLADISVPPSLYAEPALALQVGPLFAESEILRLR